MKQELVAYLIQDTREVSDMPTDELLVALHHLTEGSIIKGQSVSSDNAAVYRFLQALKSVMQTAKPPFPESIREVENEWVSR